ncbi:EAL domain-containing protein [Candidatus Nitrotoga arctica]|uniref:Cyclic-guanylate-specific phosphodiesterase n=1 Tax=Candidatus Nitrotoga arctica TaxID=453162 RepID=A0ABM8Z156_9PROT|nr:EAL domain-containing protein [Candidatus Nitrotoga arctica]CAG9933632.1 putative Cyclic-guanylate-specific phosphodiesterase [Candidatus Nitrotoga arctica]
MNKPTLRTLIIEDSEDDALLLTRYLQQTHELIHVRVDSAEGLSQALKQGEWDLVLSDHSMPGFDSFAALQIVQQSGRDLPFIIVSGAIGEDLAVAAIKAGAHDYLLKSNLKRLIPAIERELQAAQARRTHFQSEQRFRATFEQAAVGIAHVGLDGRWLRVNHKLCVITGYSEEELLTHDRPSITYPDDMPDELNSMQQLLAGDVPSSTKEIRYTRKDGSPVWVNLTWSLTRTSTGEPDYFIEVIEDITERKEATERLRLFARIFDTINEGVAVTDASNNIMLVNPAFSTITGYSATEAIGKNPRILHSGLMDKMFYDKMWQSIKKTGRWQGEITDRRKNGESYVEWLSISTMKDERGEFSHHIAVVSDISERKAAEERMVHIAQHDFLTGLPNRMMLHDRLTQAIAHAEREQRKVAVMFLDLDRFKAINDTLGHLTGDKLLQLVAGRINSVARTSDTVSRLGGDEFAIMLPYIENTDDIAMIALKLLASIAGPYVVDGNEIEVTTSIGISVFPEDGTDSESLIAHADAAMYQAKGNGRNNYQFFTREMNRRTLERILIKNKLSHALERNELFLLYQPQVDLQSGHIIGAEALVRWDNPLHGKVLPAQFIPIAEENGLIPPIGEWVLREACRQNQEWRKLGLMKITMAVNLSSVQFRQKNLGETIKAILSESGLAPSGLELEITEGVVMQDAEAAILLLEDMKAMGLKLSVDDFGTGYSSLSYLKRFPIDKFKIDQSFVRDLTTDTDDAVIVSTIISMAHSLKLKVIAEGVETAEQLAFLKQQGCDEIQGYYFSQPVSAEEFTKLLSSGRGLFEL